MAQNKNTKKTAKNAKKTENKTAPKNAPQKKETAMTKQATPKKSVAQKTANPKPAPKNAQKETRNANDYVVASIQIKIDRKIHTVTKRFAANKSPFAAVVVTLLATGQPHVITWTRSDALAKSHCRRVARQYCTADATIEQRYANPVVIPCEIRRATPEEMLLPVTSEDRTWIRASRDAAGKNKTAANAAEMDA